IGFVADLMRRPWSGNVRELSNLAQVTARLNLHPGAFQAPHRLSPPAAEAARDLAAVRASDTLEPQTGPLPISTSGSGETPPASGERAIPPALEARLRAAAESLGLMQKTVQKLLPPEARAALGAEAQREILDDAALAARLEARVAEALLALLEARDFNQSAVAAALGTSRTTVVKLMDDLALPRAADLDADAIARARAQAGGDLDAAAKLLRVSPSALKKRVTLLNLKGRG